jgi:proteasome lid subunit RPN8/RPN11
MECIRMASERDETRRVICAPRARASLLADVAQRPHIEACGLLLGEMRDGSWLVEDAVPLRNTREAASYFEFDPVELLEQDLRWGERIIGAYHSHPGGPPRPSRTDVDNMKNNEGAPWVWLILSPTGTTPLGPVESGNWRSATVAAFRVERGTVIRFPVDIAPEAPTSARMHSRRRRCSPD